MVPPKLNCYFYCCDIIRNGQTAQREGTVNAETPLDAIDAIYTMGDEVWKRSVIEITISHPQTHEVLSTSNIGSRYRSRNKPYKPKTMGEACGINIDTKADDGWINYASNKDEYWSVATIGTYFRARTFGRLIAFHK